MEMHIRCVNELCLSNLNDPTTL